MRGKRSAWRQALGSDGLYLYAPTQYLYERGLEASQPRSLGLSGRYGK